DGWSVEYHGAEHGLEDHGIDLIATKPARVVLIQCKRWRAEKLIHERHVLQLAANAILRREQEPQGTRVYAKLVATCGFGDYAVKCASALGVALHPNKSIGRFPAVKCNVGRQNGDRIYHLPWDQQYSTTKIEPRRGERLVFTPREAFEAGFRRAFRWSGNRDHG
ncbi:MAG: restriction endonuclease, partial [Verrucomicrobia bacterium]|nr:restriction endonuclease [Verrucomicrobiota bacterium]